MEVEIRKYKKEDIPSMVEIWNKVVEDANAFPQIDKLSEKGAKDFFASQTFTGVAIKDKLTFFSSAAEVDAPKRPQLVAGVTDGNSPPIKFFKGEVKCPATHTLCTSNEVEASVGFDGYSERRCGTMETVGSMKISRSTNILESCNNPTGLFCCNAV